MHGSTIDSANIADQIEIVRQEMIQKAMEFGSFTDPQVLAISQRLDQLVLCIQKKRWLEYQLPQNHNK
ncbi:aspartyl-phosphate phosphatase Spo0E family protein [Brevibacillus daliensis]|uniref:aspartyl-phosphate phosphatase Spo0E family protein n=1 Tax=Brevibacillus daliensis TaxID=2892995 RepID=UPI001E4F6744|nr:aspartyl-phosphate phosphatase Spo0E family protein [Brevibacillus daliensis]